MTMAIFIVALGCSSIAYLYAHKRLNQALIWVLSAAAIVFAFVGGHILPATMAAKIAGMQATLDNAAISFILLVPVFTVMSVMKKPPSNGGVPPMG